MFSRDFEDFFQEEAFEGDWFSILQKSLEH